MILATGMNILIRQATIADSRSAFNGQTFDIFIKNGFIEQIGPNLQIGDSETIEGDHLIVSPGFTDIFSHFCDPGIEHKETLETGAAAAKAGGYTRVMVLPNTKPTLSGKSQVEYILQKSKGLGVEILPIGSITQGCEGKDLAEMMDMRQSGAVAFSDGLHPVQNSQVLLKALQYVKAFNGIVIQVPDEQNLSRTGLMNEGIISTRLGLPGKPALAETLMLARDIELLRYTGSRLHVTGISTAQSVDSVRKAKQEGLKLTCSVTPYHLCFCDEDLQNYDTNLMVNPPLRTRADMEALRQAVLDGTIDCIASHHQPHEWDSKTCEFEYAKYGMEGLESCLGAVGSALPDLPVEKIAELFAIRPAEIFGLDLPVIAPGNQVNLTLFEIEKTFTFQPEHIKSRSKNNAFIDKKLNFHIFKTII
jgi:dihydroorotase